MLVGHDTELCIAWPARAPLICHAKALFLMRHTQEHGAKDKSVMRGGALQCGGFSLTCVTNFQTQTYLQCIGEEKEQNRRGTVFHSVFVVLIAKKVRQFLVAPATLSNVKMSGSARMQLVMLHLDST